MKISLVTSQCFKLSATASIVCRLKKKKKHSKRKRTESSSKLLLFVSSQFDLAALPFSLFGFKTRNLIRLSASAWKCLCCDLCLNLARKRLLILAFNEFFSFLLQLSSATSMSYHSAGHRCFRLHSLISRTHAWYPTQQARKNIIVSSMSSTSTIFSSGNCFPSISSKGYSYINLMNTEEYRNCAGSPAIDSRSGQIGQCRHRCDVASELCCPGAEPRRWIRHSLHSSA